MATVFSNDGTKILEDADPSPVLPPSRITQLGKSIKIDGVHITDIGAPAGGNSDALDGLACLTRRGRHSITSTESVAIVPTQLSLRSQLRTTHSIRQFDSIPVKKRT